MYLHNLMEDIVSSCLKDLAKHHPELGEWDEQLANDIMAVALNRLPTKYVSTSKGEMFAKTQLRAQVESDVYKELAHAIEKVLNSRRDRAFSQEDGEETQ